MSRNFTLLWLGGAVSAVGSRASAIAFPLLVLASGGSATDAGLVAAAAMLPHLLLQLVAGALVDRWNRRTVMLVTDAGRVLVIGSVAWAVLFAEPTLSHLVAAAFAEGVLTVFHVLAQRAAVRTVVADHELAAAMSRNEATTRAAFLAGQPLGGALFAVGRAVPFLADVASYLVSLGTVLALRGQFRANPDTDAQPAHLWRDVWHGLRWLLHRPFLRTAALSISVSNLLVHAAYLTVIVTITRQGGSPFVVGLVLAGTGAGGIAGALTAPWVARRLPMGTIFVGVNWLWAGLILLIALAGQPLVSAIAFALFAYAGATCNVVVGAYQLRITPQHLMARVSSVIGTVSWGTIPLGSLLAGVLLDRYGGTTPLALLSGLMVLVAIAVTSSPVLRRATDSADSDSADPGRDRTPDLSERAAATPAA